jgi:predicted Ser/Thr protein kinase
VFNPFQFFRKSKSGSGSRSRAPLAHITWASGTITRGVSRTRIFLKRQIWLWPIIATVILAAIGYWVRVAIESTIKQGLQSQLQTLLDVQTAMLVNWLKMQSANATSLANDLEVRENILAILAARETDSPAADAPPPAELQKHLQKRLKPALSSQAYSGYFVADSAHRIVSASHAELIGKTELPEYASFINAALQGETTVGAPFASKIMMKDATGMMRPGLPTMFVCAPIRDPSFEVVAVLALRIRPELEFTRILQLGRFGESGETYAVNKDGLMVSNSRFDDSLVLLGVLADQPDAHSIVTVQVRDPQADMTAGYRPPVRRSELPLTRPAAAISAGTSGVDMDGYRDYRGVVSVGAWKWLPKYGIGLITEVDVAEAFRPITILQWTFGSLFVLLALSSIAIFVFTIVVARLHREAQKAEIEAQQLGQYRLERKLGAGGMGVVYKGQHAMLHRQTAIKMLDVDKVNDASIARFEREVQMTCQLNHPNTIAIYDYGRTPEGLFYYAMEYLDGINLQTLVEKYGPQPEGRVIHILSQVCGSLFEAHSLGLVHRDIKPANIMINRRGGETDVVKVLDFGLVKALDEAKQAGATAANSLTGTPLYMAPEAIQAPNTVDARSDLYAVGAVGYFLLAGNPVFDTSSLVELCQQHVETTPLPPSQKLGKPVSDELEHALLVCLEKSRNKRPSTARDLAQLLARCPTAGSWSIDDADAWWGRHERGLGPAPAATSEIGKAGTVYDRTVITGRPDAE